MTKNTFKNFDRVFIGFDRVANLISGAAEQTVGLLNYPPYNIKKIEDNKYVIEMAVAGFGKHDIEIELHDNKLVIKGKTDTSVDFDPEQAEDIPAMLYQGLSLRPFTRTFNLADNIEIGNASMLNGILKIALEAIIPESKKTVKVEIQTEEGSK